MEFGHMATSLLFSGIDRGQTTSGVEGRQTVGLTRGTSGVSQLLGSAKLQSAPGANNPCYAAAVILRYNSLGMI